MGGGKDLRIAEAVTQSSFAIATTIHRLPRLPNSTLFDLVAGSASSALAPMPDHMNTFTPCLTAGRLHGHLAPTPA